MAEDSNGQQSQPASPRSKRKSSKKKTPFEVYFLLVLFGFASISVFLSTTTSHLHTQKQQQQQQQHEAAAALGNELHSSKDFFSKQRLGARSSSRNRRSRRHEDLHQQDAARSKILAERQVIPPPVDRNGPARHNNDNRAPTVVGAKQESYTQKSQTTTTTTKLAGLDCSRFGGPPNEFAQEMVYWKDIPSDNRYVSPLHHTKDASGQAQEQYMTFEPDQGGFNNIRMAMETVLALAFAMGRTLVLPPENRMYLLGKDKNARQGNKDQRNQFSFAHFFHMEAIHEEHVGLNIISMEEFLKRQGITGKFRDYHNRSQAVFPPQNRTNWDGTPQPINKWLRQHARSVIWTPEECMAVFPASEKHEDVQELRRLHAQMLRENPDWQHYVGHPTPVNASTYDRMKEHSAGRPNLCLYDEEMQAAPYIHYPADHSLKARLLVHSYAFLFFQDWKQDLWMKRFIRDHVRYIDEIQCAAARVVHAVRQRAKQHSSQIAPNGEFDSIHIRRGDFQYKITRIGADEIYKQTRRQLREGTTLYVATDEQDQAFFDPLRQHYNLVSLNDFHAELGDINSNYYGMIDQLVASRGEVFFGCWFSTFTGYITRIRGYHADAMRYPNYEQGVSNSWYYVMKDRYDHLQTYYPVKQSFWAREFPTSWRLIDTGVDNIATSTTSNVNAAI